MAAARTLGLPVRAEHLPAFERYGQELAVWNERFNLTAITDYEQVQLRHFADSLTCVLAHHSICAAARQGMPWKVADVGTGAGFPGLPLKIVWPAISLVLIESVGKKCRFLEHMVNELSLSRVTIINARAEEVGQEEEFRESCDLVVARAVADMAVLAEYCLPLARLNGLFVAQKGDDVEGELVRAEGALNVLGGTLENVCRVEVPGVASPRSLVVVRKTALTPPQYPRRVGVPSRRPLAAG